MMVRDGGGGGTLLCVSKEAAGPVEKFRYRTVDRKHENSDGEEKKTGCVLWRQ